MTVNTLTIELTCNGKTLKMGPGQDIDITAVSGLESSEVEISTWLSSMVAPVRSEAADTPISSMPSDSVPFLNC